jgi:propionate CoA-transferase
MGLKKELMAIPLEERFVYNARNNTFYANLSNCNIRTSGEIQRIRALIEEILAPLGKKVSAVINYDNFNISPELTREYADMLEYVTQFYENVTRYTASAFLLMKLGDELERRDVDPQLVDNLEEAQKILQNIGA